MSISPDVMSRENPRRSEVEALVQTMAPALDADLGVYRAGFDYNPRQVLARLPGDDLHAIGTNATRQALRCATIGKGIGVVALLIWITGLRSLFVSDTPLAALPSLAAGTLGIWWALHLMARAQQATRLMTALRDAVRSR